jgi:hypothetical protein
MNPIPGAAPPETAHATAGLTGPAAAPPSPSASAQTLKLVEERDNARETLETVAFVVFLVLLLKGFVAEAFVIPTGSMATTLLGEHTSCVCERCGYPFPSNNQLNTQRKMLTAVECPNCRLRMALGDKVRLPEGGDKVLVLKPQYDLHAPKRHDVFVFKFPGEPYYLTNGPGGMGFGPQEGLKRNGGPQEDFGPKNFIKRLWGLPGEKLAIWQGDVYLAIAGEQGVEKLEIIRRAPRLLLTMRRIVNDNQYLAQAGQPPLATRWKTGSDWQTNPAAPGWIASDGGKTFASTGSEATEWLRYRHLFVPEEARRNGERMDRPEPPAAGTLQPRLITDFLAYNEDWDQHHHWVGDLMVDVEADVAENKGELILELNQGIDCHRAVFDLASGVCRLATFRNGQELKLDQATTEARLAPGRHRLRFADFDQRLTLWVDEKLAFGDGVAVPPVPKGEKGPRLADLFPVSIGAKGARVSVTNLQVWRDIYYTQACSQSGLADLNVGVGAAAVSEEEIRRLVESAPADPAPHAPALTVSQIALHRARPASFEPYYTGSRGSVRMDEPTYYPIQHPVYHPSDRFGPDEYFALGDNSVQSKDSRAWGQVPRRLLMGKAVWVYWPWNRWMLIR